MICSDFCPKLSDGRRQTSIPLNTFLHFEPDPNFHPPSREARVFSGMAGDLVVDNQQHRICSMNGRLIQEVTFGGGLLGKLKKGSSFSLEQAQVGPSSWQLTAIHVHLGRECSAVQKRLAGSG